MKLKAFEIDKLPFTLMNTILAILKQDTLFKKK